MSARVTAGAPMSHTVYPSKSSQAVAIAPPCASPGPPAWRSSNVTFVNISSPSRQTSRDTPAGFSLPQPKQVVECPGSRCGAPAPSALSNSDTASLRYRGFKPPRHKATTTSGSSKPWRSHSGCHPYQSIQRCALLPSKDGVCHATGMPSPLALPGIRILFGPLVNAMALHPRRSDRSADS